MTAIGTLADDSKKHTVTGKQLEVGDKLSSIPIPYYRQQRSMIKPRSGLSSCSELVPFGLNLPFNLGRFVRPIFFSTLQE